MAEGAPAAIGKPKLPSASPVGGLVCPLGELTDPRLTTPAWGSAEAGEGSYADFGGEQRPQEIIGGLGQIDTWAWEMGSEAGTIPSAWSKATSRHTGHSTTRSVSSATGDGLIPGLVDGQRLSTVKPLTVPTTGGKIVVSLRKEVPQGYWDNISVVLVNLPMQVTLKPTGIRKGKKLCVDVPPGLTPDDYEIRLKFGEKIIQGSIQICIRDGDGAEDMEDDDDAA